MTSYIAFLQQLPQVLQSEIAAHLGSTAGMSELQTVGRYRDVAWHIRNAKLASLPAGYEAVPPHLTSDEFNGMSSGSVDTTGVAPYFLEIRRQILASEGAWFLENFLNQTAVVQTQLAEAAQQLAQRQAEEAARQLAQRQAEEAARQLAQRQAEEAARQLAQRQAEEAARQLAQRQAEEVARLAAEAAARQLAQQQAEAAAQAFAQRMAEEEALREARLALELAAVPATVEARIEGAINQGESPVVREAMEIRFIPGPAATAEIELATLKLKHSVDAAVSQFASDIGPYLKPAQAGAGMGMTHSA
jgi:DNA segregation ATPase FtsK/SpoIIIE-like protein